MFIYNFATIVSTINIFDKKLKNQESHMFSNSKQGFLVRFYDLSAKNSPSCHY